MPKKINPELRARALRMVQEHQQDYPSQTAAAQALPKQLGLGRRGCGAGSPPGSTVAWYELAVGLHGHRGLPASAQADSGGAGCTSRSRPGDPFDLVEAGERTVAERAARPHGSGLCRARWCSVSALSYASPTEPADLRCRRRQHECGSRHRRSEWCRRSLDVLLVRSALRRPRHLKASALVARGTSPIVGDASLERVSASIGMTLVVTASG